MMLRLRGFVRDRRGSVALVFALVILVLIGAVGVAFDYSRATLVRSNLQRAVDAAALLAAKNRDLVSTYTLPDAIAASYLRNTFDVDQLSDLKVKVIVEDERVRVDASGNLKTTIANVLGFRSMPIASTAVALFGDTKVEIALVLDNTGSMNQLAKLATLKTAAHNFVSKMQGSTGDPEAIKIALVPFDTTVNVGAFKGASWIDSATASHWAANPGAAGCVWDRQEPYDVQDTPPMSGMPGTLFGADTSKASNCTLAPILPLTNDFSALHAGIDRMVAVGYTNTTIGLAWGMHVLSSAEPITNAAPAGTKRVTKYMIFMTDGENTKNRNSMSPTVIDARTRRVCDSLRAAKVQVFTARIMEGNASLLTECATSPDMYYDVQNVSQLDPVFNAIYALITGSRLSQ